VCGIQTGVSHIREGSRPLLAALERLKLAALVEEVHPELALGALGAVDDRLGVSRSPCL
jgi:hypothetical protein